LQKNYNLKTKYRLKTNEDTLLLEKEIINIIKEKKGKDIIVIDLRKLNYDLCDKFIICHGDSTVQVAAIAQGIEEKIKENLNILPHHIEGYTNALWILMDYQDIVLHIFFKPVRDYYKLEDLWGDADIIKIDEED